MKLIKYICITAALLISASATAQERKVSSRPRVIVTCDPELDDNNSMIRFLLFSTDFKVEGLIYASSQFHWRGDGKGTKWYVPGREYSKNGLNLGPMESWRWAKGERFIDAAVDAYAESYPNLKIHDANYPTPEFLKSKVRMGNVDFDGDYSKDTPGSELIKQILLADNDEQVFLMAWGGASTIARALKSIEDIYSGTSEWESIKAKVSRKGILSLSGDQDDTYAKYIKPFWPDMKQMQGGGMTVGLAYNVQNMCSKEDAQYYTPEWMAKNIIDKGPFGKIYRYWGDGKQMVKGDVTDYFGLSGYTVDQLKKMGYVVWSALQPKGSFLAEGDTFTYLNLIGNGLNAYKNDTYGGWGGAKTELPDSVKNLSFMDMMRYNAKHKVLPDYTAAVMNGLAARFQWSVISKYSDANHYPVIKGIDKISAKAGEKVTLKCTVSDPDKDKLALNWKQYKVGTYKGTINVDKPFAATTTVTIPADAMSGQTLHFVLEATDDGTPHLNIYHRIIVTVK